MITGKEASEACGDLDGDGYVTSVDSDSLSVTIVRMEQNGIVLEPTVIESPYPGKVIKRGDADLDGDITYKDNSLIKEMVVGLIPPALFADTDDDGYITPVDIDAVEAAIVGIPMSNGVYKMIQNPDCAAIPGRMTGDLNGDGLLNDYDEDVMIQISKGLEPYDICGDFDMDGFMGPADISMFNQAIREAKYYGLIFEPKVKVSPSVGKVIKKGDADLDGEVDYKDLGLLIEMMKGWIPVALYADADNDGFIGPGDLSIATAISKGLPVYKGVYKMVQSPDCIANYGRITGDLNGDGLVNDYDEEVLIQMNKGFEPYDVCADFNMDGYIGAADVTQLIEAVKEAEYYGMEFEAKTVDPVSPQDAVGVCGDRGDVNADKKMDYKDLGLTNEMAKGMIPPSASADMNRDGYIGAADVSIMTSMIKNLYINYAPMFEQITAQKVNETEKLAFTVNATDSNWDCIAYSAANLPAGAVFNGQTFEWTPNSTQSGNYTVTFTATDESTSTEMDVSIEVPVTKVIVNYTLPSNPECEKIGGMTGELNGDGVIDYLDIEVISHMAKGLEERSPCADIDMDGFISSGDISLLRYVILKIRIYNITQIPHLPANDADTCVITGDINFDNKVDYKDLGIMKKMVKGSYPVSERADMDGDGFISGGDISLITSKIKGLYKNHAPILDQISAQTVNMTETLTFTLNATDYERNKLRYSASSLPAGAVFADQTFSWTPDSTQSGNYTVMFTVSDCENSTEMNVSIEVLAAAQEENHTETPAMNVTLSADALSGIGSVDVNFTCSVQNGEAPYGMGWAVYTADESTVYMGGAFMNGTSYSFNQTLEAGNWTAICTVSDMNLTVISSNNVTISISEAIIIPPTPVNHAPVFGQIAAQTVNETENLTFTINATDADGDNVTYSAANLPTGAVMNGTAFSWMPNSTQSGNYTVTFTATDGMNATQMNASIEVLDKVNQSDDDEDDDDQGEDNNDQGGDTGGNGGSGGSGGSHHSGGSGVLYAPKTGTTSSTQSTKLISKDSTTPSTQAQTPAEPDNNKEGLMTITGDVVQDASAETGISALKIAGIMLWIFAVLLAAMLIYGKVQQKNAENPESMFR
jgi:hypothetical protein